MTIDLNILKLRHFFLKALRAFFDDQGFLEVETPILLGSNTPDPHIDPIFAHLSHPHARMRQLHTSPELWLKRALALGAENIYQVAKVFRDDPPSPSHSQEFTMAEWYRSHAALSDLIEDCQVIFQKSHEIAKKLAYNVMTPLPTFQYCSVSEAFLRYANIDLPKVLTEVDNGNYLYLNNLLKDRGDHLAQGTTFIDAFFLVMIKYVEPSLQKESPTVITRWPVQLAALAAPCADDPLLCDRFEIYFQGLEIANAYQECFDPKILIPRFEKDNRERKALGKQVFNIDKMGLSATSALPKTAGIALGVDRLLMATLQKNHIKDLILGYENPKI